MSTPGFCTNMLDIKENGIAQEGDIFIEKDTRGRKKQAERTDQVTKVSL